MFNEENARVRYEVLKSIEGFSEDQLNEKPGEGRWSPVQILDHLQKMEWHIARGVEEEVKKDEQIRALKKPIGLTLNRSLKVEAPGRLVPEERFRTLEEMRHRLDQSHNKLYEVYNAADQGLLVRNSMPHPLFGRIPLIQWFEFVALHERRHLAQLKETLRELNEKTVKA